MERVPDGEEWNRELWKKMSNAEFMEHLRNLLMPQMTAEDLEAVVRGLIAKEKKKQQREQQRVVLPDNAANDTEENGGDVDKQPEADPDNN